MKKIVLILVAFNLISFLSCSEESINNENDFHLEESIDTDIESPISLKPKPIELKIANLINVYRVKNNLKPLRLEKGIVKIKAKEHNMYMIEKSELSHDFFKERSRVIMNRTKAFRVGENVACGYNKAKILVDAWIASPKHKANILGDFNYFDISTDHSKSGVMYSTNIFIKK